MQTTAITCPRCGCADFEKRGERRTYHPLNADLEADSWNEGDIEMDMFDGTDDEVVYCCGCDSEFREWELKAHRRRRARLTNEEINQRIEAWQEGDSNDAEIDGLTAIVRELQAERTAASSYAPLPDNVIVCVTCGTGQGYVWPMNSNMRDDHYYVERCDACERFDSDQAAADFIAARLHELGLTFDQGAADIGTPGIPQPYIENVQ